MLDDEPALLRVAAAHGERLGVRVETTPGPDAAIRRIGAEPDGYEAVIVDQLMPDRTGIDVPRQIRAHSGVDVYLSSGYTPDELRGDDVRGDLAGLLPKPFDYEDFRALLGHLAPTRHPRP